MLTNNVADQERSAHALEPDDVVVGSGAFRYRVVRDWGTLPEGWDRDIPTFDVKETLATRNAGGRVQNAIAAHYPQLFGGSADLNPSTTTQRGRACGVCRRARFTR